MKKRLRFNEKGLTLIELLAVLVILGIVAAIAIISISRVIQDSKDRAFVANALALKEAANLFLRQESVHDSFPSKITYKMLYDSDYIDEFKDPDTNDYLSPTDQTFVIVKDQKIDAVCLQGTKRNLCSYQGENTPVPFNKLSVELISSNK